MRRSATLAINSRYKISAISRDTLDIYAPLAHRLGIDRIKLELEDLALRHLLPQEYERIEQYLNKTDDEREQLLQRSIAELQEHLRREGLKVEVRGRRKHYYGIYRKEQVRGVPLAELADLIALRVICDNPGACYEAMGQTHSLWRAIPGKFKDYISSPKENGYQSIHTAVIGVDNQVTEIQLRTREMHRLCEEGIAAHWRYKEGLKSDDAQLSSRLVWLRRLINWLTEIDDPNEFLDSLKESVALESIFCFTPHGDVFEVPVGATPVDFAFRVHSEIGLRCTGCKINGRIAPLRSELHNGEMVEIITSKSGHPSPSWLEIVKTSKARSKIRRWLKTQNLEENVQRGRELLLRGIKGRGLALSWAELREKIEEKLSSLRCASVDEVLLELGFGSLSAQSVIERLIPPRRKQPKKARHQPSTSGVIVADVPGATVRLAKCCSPVPGNLIVGYITIGRGVSIHRRDCPGLAALLERQAEEQRLLDAKWDERRLPRFEVSVRVRADDRAGLLSDITSWLHEQNFLILGAETRTDKQTVAVMRFQVEVTGKAQIDSIIVGLRRIPSVFGVDQISAKPISEE